MRTDRQPSTGKAFRNALGFAFLTARADGRAALVQRFHKPSQWREKRQAAAASWPDYADTLGAR